MKKVKEIFVNEKKKDKHYKLQNFDIIQYITK